jgi:hypothetical protein
MQRNPTLDLLRGVLLLLMTMTHLPTVWSAALGEPLGFISAAEGFLFLSAFMAGKIFVSRCESLGPQAARRWMFARALRLYFAHVALLLLAFTVAAWIATHFQRPALHNLLDFYFQSPRRAMVGSATLLYQPPLLDILPMYILFFLGTPVVMRTVDLCGWRGVLGASVAVWLAAQFGLRASIHHLLEQSTGWDVPLTVSGSFDLYAWQLLWTLGLWFGAMGADRTRKVLSSSSGTLIAALAVSTVMFAWRRYSGPMGFEDLARHLFWIDKWTLSPVRMVNFVAMLCVVLGVGARLVQHLRIPRMEELGRASLWVFVAHIAFVLLSLGLTGGEGQPLSGTTGVIVILAGYAVLFFTAALYRRLRMRPAAPGTQGFA